MVGLELIFVFQQWIWIASGVVVCLMLIGTILVKIEEKEKFLPTQAVLPVLTAFGLGLFSVFLPTTLFTHFYIIGAGLIFLFALQLGARQAYPVWNWALSLVAYFLNIAAIFGFYFHLYIPILIVLCTVFLVTAALALQGLRRVSFTIQTLVLPALGMALGLTEVAWALLFLPAHYLVGAGILTTLYYIMFNLITISYQRVLTRKDILEYLGLGIISALIIIMTARWT